MLVLNRKTDQWIRLRDLDGEIGDLEILIVDSRAGVARLGITAPVRFQILRDELVGRPELAPITRQSAAGGLGKRASAPAIPTATPAPGR